MMETVSSMSSTNYSVSAYWQNQTFGIVFFAQIIQYLMTTIPNQTTLVISIKAQHRFDSKEVKNKAAFFEDINVKYHVTLALSLTNKWTITVEYTRQSTQRWPVG